MGLKIILGVGLAIGIFALLSKQAVQVRQGIAEKRKMREAVILPEMG